MKDHAMHNSSKENFHIEFSSVPSKPTALTPVKLIFGPKNSKSFEAAALEVVHEKDIHLLIVSEDLFYFAHEHPHKMEDKYVHIHEFPHGGNFVLFIDYTPVGSVQQISRHELKLEGKFVEHKTLADKKLVWEENGYKLHLRENKIPLKVNTDLNLTLILEKESSPIINLENYLGALAHVVIISEDTKDYLHVHPMESRKSGPEIMLHTSFPKLGKYKMFVQFKHKGKIHTAYLILNIAE